MRFSSSYPAVLFVLAIGAERAFVNDALPAVRRERRPSPSLDVCCLHESYASLLQYRELNLEQPNSRVEALGSPHNAEVAPLLEFVNLNSKGPFKKMLGDVGDGSIHRRRCCELVPAATLAFSSSELLLDREVELELELELGLELEFEMELDLGSGSGSGPSTGTGTLEPSPAPPEALGLTGLKGPFEETPAPAPGGALGDGTTILHRREPALWFLHDPEVQVGSSSTESAPECDAHGV